MKGQRAHQVGPFLKIESPGGFAVGRWSGQAATGPGVERAFRAMWSVGEICQFGLDFASGAVAGIDDAESFEPVQGCLIAVSYTHLTLPTNREV